MFILKSTLNLILSEKDARISDLKEQIELLRSLAIPPQSQNRVTLQEVEADAVMSGYQDQIELTSEQLKELEEQEAERERLLSGNY